MKIIVKFANLYGALRPARGAEAAAEACERGSEEIAATGPNQKEYVPCRRGAATSRSEGCRC